MGVNYSYTRQAPTIHAGHGLLKPLLPKFTLSIKEKTMRQLITIPGFVILSVPQKIPPLPRLTVQGKAGFSLFSYSLCPAKQ